MEESEEKKVKQQLLDGQILIPAEELKKNTDKKLECVSCGQELTEDNKIFSEEQECWVCETCYDEDEPSLTILTNDSELDCDGYGIQDDDGLYRVFVKHYSNDTAGQFKAKYIRTDGWRGYYDVIASRQWKKFHTDCILAYSEDSKDLKDFDEKLEEYLSKKNVRFAKVFSRTSNVFSTGYDFFVRREDFRTANDVKKLMELVGKLKNEYRDEEKFAITALTGSSNKTKEAKQLLQASKLIEQGMDAESVMNEIMKVN